MNMDKQIETVQELCLNDNILRDLLDPELMLIGGTNTMRGFNENQPAKKIKFASLFFTEPVWLSQRQKLK